MSSKVTEAEYERLVSQHRGYLWGLCFRMTGNAEQADDLVQDTFARALEKPPPDTRRPWRPWLTRVAVNLSRDALRRRKHVPYVGEWLPSVMETAELEQRGALDTGGTDARYEQLESVTTAFLCALEALTEQQRAVLLLRDVFDYSVKETAQALDLSESNVKTTLHRARAVMADYDSTRKPMPELSTRVEETLGRMMQVLARADYDGLRALLSEQVREYGDGGGEFLAARKVVTGPENVARFLIGLAEKRGQPVLAQLRHLNGLPSIYAEYEAGHPRDAPRFTMTIRLDADGRIDRVYSTLATAKLCLPEGAA